MQGQSKTKKYWAKDNYLKAKQQKNNKSTIKQSFKGICTNIWYKLGGQSIISKTSSSKTQFKSLSMLGKQYSLLQAAEQQLKKLFWFTYRKQIKVSSELKSDLGWGCLIRVGQMLLANTLKRYFQSNDIHIDQQSFITSFLDNQQGTQNNYSFERILRKGQQKFNLKAGQWYNISQICYVIMALQNNTPMKGSQALKMVYFNQSLIFLDQVFVKINLNMCTCEQRKMQCPLCNGSVDYRRSAGKSIDQYSIEFDNLNILSQLEDEDQFFQNFQVQQNPKSQQQHNVAKQSQHQNQKQRQKQQQMQKISFDLLLVVSTRISHSNIDKNNFEAILQLLNMSTSMGIIGGVPGKGLYFVGSLDDNLIYLDPHLVQSFVNRANLSKQIQSFHCSDLRMIGRQKLDSSIAFAFYIKSLKQLNQLIQKIEEIKRQNPQIVPISWMWQNQYRDSGQINVSNEYELDENSPDFSFIA